MDEAHRLKLEDELYRKNLENLVTTRTEQLKQALSRNGELLGSLKQMQSMDSLAQIQAAVQALIKKLESPVETQWTEIGAGPREPKKTGNPIIDKMLSNIDTPEKAQAMSEVMRATVDQINSGAPIPPVKASDLKQLWDVDHRVRADLGPPRPGVATGLTVYAGYGFEAAAAPPDQLMPITLRYQLLSTIIERGVLRDYLHDEELDEQVFRAAATLPCNKDDLAQAMMPAILRQMPPDELAKVKEGMRAAGHDVNKPDLDGKFLEWMRNSQ